MIVIMKRREYIYLVNRIEDTHWMWFSNIDLVGDDYRYSSIAT